MSTCHGKTMSFYPVRWSSITYDFSQPLRIWEQRWGKISYFSVKKAFYSLFKTDLRNTIHDLDAPMQYAIIFSHRNVVFLILWSRILAISSWIWLHQHNVIAIFGSSILTSSLPSWKFHRWFHHKSMFNSVHA